MTRPLRIALATALIAVGSPGFAQDTPPRVVTDILPVQGLVAQVMKGIGAPAVLMGPDAEPHTHRMRPSEAAALQQADLVVWIGMALSPPFAKAREQLAGEAPHLELMALPGSNVLAMRAGAVHDHDDHGHDKDDHGHDKDDHGHDKDDTAHADHDDHDHDEHGHDAAKHDDHAHESSKEDHDDHAHSEEAHDGDAEDGHDHAAGTGDPHAWLDPANARLWLSAVANELARIDPPRADTYLANANAGAEAITRAEADLAAAVSGLDARVLVASHDAYQYLEEHFGLRIEGSVRAASGAAPGAKRLQELQAALQGRAGICVLSDPSVPARQVDSVLGDVPHRVVSLDPVGRTVAPGPQFYPALLTALAEALAECAKPM